METISLDTRIRRIRSGMCSSPEHILPGLRAFADLPVNAVLSLFFPDLQMKFNNYMSTLYRKPSSSITYGDLAVMITDDYIRNGIHNGKTADSLILFYFTCLEADSLIREKVKGNNARYKYLEELGMLDLRDITDIAMGEYLDAVLKVPMDKSIARKVYAFRLEKAGVMNMTVSAVYQELVEYARRYDGYIADPVKAGFPAHSLSIRERIVELLAAPVAYVTVESNKIKN